MFVDTHAHLDFAKFESDRIEVIQRAKQGGVGKIINVACNAVSLEKSRLLAEQNELIYFSLGIHPHDADQLTDEILRSIEKNKDHQKLVAIGEIGLDYYRMHNSKELQQEAFRKQLQLAQKINLPAIVHCRDAFTDVLRIIEEEGNKRVVFHCFSGNLKEAKQLWERGFWTSFTGTITYPNNEVGREVVRNCPLKMMMVETDSPFLAPQSKRGERNEPLFVKEVAEKIAELKEIDLAKIEIALRENVTTFFSF